MSRARPITVSPTAYRSIPPFAPAPVVMAHFLLSMVLVANAVVLHRRAGLHDADDARSAPSPLRTATRVLVAVAAVVIVTGTIVTGAGPHGGDENVRRLGFAVSTVA